MIVIVISGNMSVCFNWM